MKPGMGFREGLTFSDNDQGCWELLPTVRTGQIDVHCECMVEKMIQNECVGRKFRWKCKYDMWE